MQLILHRTYYPTGTNGVLKLDDELICYTIELPWRNNLSRLSCIPPGEYRLVKRYSENHGNHLILEAVEGRSLILIHPANNALEELRGCIAPVSTLTAPGCGDASRAAFRKVLKLATAAINKKELVTLKIVKNDKQ